VEIRDPSPLCRTLGVQPGAPTSQVRQAYRELLRRLHPGANPAASPAGLDEVVRAYRARGARHIDVFA
jgi:curved DNA-binding protein CbpA